MKRLRDFFTRAGAKKDRGDAVLVTTLISIPLLCVCFAFATGISMANWQKTSYESAAQAAAAASLQSVQSNGYLGRGTMQSFVREYLSQTGRASGLTSGGVTAAGQGAGAAETANLDGGVCSTAVINGVTRQLPYIELQLDINRSAGESIISTYPYWSAGSGGTLNNPEGGHGTVVDGQQYRVINAKVWEASRNITWFGFASQQDMTCQPYNLDVSAILFGNNEDLNPGEQCFQPDLFPVNPTVVRQVNTTPTVVYESPLTTCDTVVTNVPKNSVAILLGTYRTWSYIEMPDGKKGWVPSSRLEDLSTWTISYNLDGGTPAATLPSSYDWKNSRDPIVLPAVSKANHDFGGWQQIDCSTNAVKANTGTIPFGSYGNLCFKAVFTLKKFTITWNPNGGVGGAAATQYDYGTVLTVPANATRTGYQSNGWYTAASGGTRVTGSVTVTQNATYYQQYTAVSNPITIDPNGGSGGSSNPVRYYINSASQTATLTPPTRAGYTFNNWTVTGGNATVSGNTLTIQANTIGEVRVRANWTAVTYNITVNTDGGSSGSASPATYKIATGITTITLPSPTKTGHTLTGYTITTNTSGGASFVSTENGKYVLKIPAGAYGNIAVKATWQAQSWNVTFNCNGRGTCPANTTYTYGVSKNIENASGGGTFDGWTLNVNDRSNMKTGTSVIPSTQTGDITLYAHWTYSYTTYYDPAGSWANQCRVGGSNYWGCSGWAGCGSDWVSDYGWVYFTMDNKGRGGDPGGGFGRSVSPVTMGGNSGNGLYYTVRANVTDWPTCGGSRTGTV